MTDDKNEDWFGTLKAREGLPRVQWSIGWAVQDDLRFGGHHGAQREEAAQGGDRVIAEGHLDVVRRAIHRAVDPDHDHGRLRSVPLAGRVKEQAQRALRTLPYSWLVCQARPQSTDSLENRPADRIHACLFYYYLL